MDTNNFERRDRRSRKRKSPAWKIILLALFIAEFLLLWKVLTPENQKTSENSQTSEASGTESKKTIEDLRPDIDVELLDINDYSRPGIALKQVNGIVIHYTANPGTGAMANRDYFNNLANTHETHASSHFIIGLQGEIVQCIPCSEIAYASNDRNDDTISIECCIQDESGQFNEATYQTAVELTAWLMVRYGLTSEDVIRHYDITGKYCPKYYVEHLNAWEQFREDAQSKAEELKEQLAASD